MRAFDTSSIVHAWDNYPIAKFPLLWNWLEGQLLTGEIAFPSVVIDELRTVSPECSEWIHSVGFRTLPMTDAVLMLALLVKEHLGIENPRGEGGVGENDIFIVCAACIEGCELISNEAVQALPPARLQKYRMPAVCALSSLKVSCSSFLQFLNSSQGHFG